MAWLQTLHYQAARGRQPEEFPIGQLGLYYAALGSAVLVVYFAVRNLFLETEILVPLGVLFWGAGVVVSIAGVFRVSGRRSAVMGLMITFVGALVYAEFFA